MSSKTTGSESVPSFICALCNLGLFDPTESYKNSDDISEPKTLFMKECKACFPFYEQNNKIEPKNDYMTKKQ